MGYLAEADVSVAELADAVAGASEKSLARATKDPAFIEALWLLLKVPQAAKAERFAEALRELGVSVPNDPSVTEVVVNRPQEVGVEHPDGWRWHEVPELTESWLRTLAVAAAACTGQDVDAERPRTEAAQAVRSP